MTYRARHCFPENFVAKATVYRPTDLAVRPTYARRSPSATYAERSHTVFYDETAKGRLDRSSAWRKTRRDLLWWSRLRLGIPIARVLRRRFAEKYVR